MANKYVNDDRLTQAITAIRDRLVIKTSTEAQALIQSVQYPSCVYYTSDTHCVVVNGNVYGRGDINFSAIQVVTTEPQSQWDTNKLVMVYNGGNTMGMFAYNGTQWVNIGEYTLSIDLTADAVSYDDTTTQLGVGNVQDAVDGIGELTLGDNTWYWASCLREVGGAAGFSTNYRINKSNDSLNGNTVASGAIFSMFFDVEEGERYKIVGASSTSVMHAWAVYGATREEMGMPVNGSSGITAMTLNEYVISGDTETTTNYDYECEVTIPERGKVMGVCFGYSGTYAKVIGDTFNVFKWKQHDGVTLADKRGMVISDWYEKGIVHCDSGTNYYRQANTRTYEAGETLDIIVGSKMWGARVKRLDVKEGDKLLLDIYAPATYSLIFTDSDYIITALDERKRIDDVVTCPNDGYVYIMDILYRNNYWFDKEFAFRAYEMLDTKRSKDNGKIRTDLFNEIPDTEDFFPLRCTQTLTTSNVSPYGFGSCPWSGLTQGGRYILQMYHYKVESGNTKNSGVMNITHRGTATSYFPITKNFNVLSVGDEGWVGWIVVDNNNHERTQPAVYITGNVSGQVLDITIDRVYEHSFDDLIEARGVLNGIIEGKYIVEHEGIVEQITDTSLVSAGMASIASLGYNIFTQGASMPVDDDGYAYGITLKDTKGKTFNGTSSAGNADLNLVYLPVMDWSEFTGTKHQVFYGCENLVTLPSDVEWNSGLVFGNTAFCGCYSLKKVPNLTPATCNGYVTFKQDYALESVGDIDFSIGANANSMFQDCMSLKEIGALTHTERSTAWWNAFYNCVALEEIPDIDLNASATNFSNMCRGCSSLKRGVVFDDTSSVTNMSNMYNGCWKMTSVPYMDTSKVTNIQGMFSQCYALTNLFTMDLTSATNCYQMFAGCISLESITLVNTGNISDCRAMFQGCFALKTLNVDFSFIENVTTLANLFNNCQSLESIPAMDTSHITEFSYTYAYCKALKRLEIDWSSCVTFASNAFAFNQCNELRYLKIANLGKSSLTSYSFANNACNHWGENSDNVTDALNSLVWTFKNLYDRSGMAKCTISLYRTIYDRLMNALTEAEQTEITNKNYTITRL